MFELFRVYETATNEKNKLLRTMYTKYAKAKLKSIFFKKFNIHNESLEVNRDLLLEFFQLYQCICDKVVINDEYPHVYKIDSKKEILCIRYYNFEITIKMINDEYNINIDCKRDYSSETIFSLSFHPDTKYLNMTFLREIILMTIYNYCVSYIYGKNSELYIDDRKYITNLFNMHF